ncbi:MAG: hypothetical protein ACOX5Z_12135 [Desulfobulbus sp.]|jgi:hypothetical protein
MHCAQKRCRWSRLLLWMLPLLVLSACATPSPELTGRWQPDSRITALFREGVILPDHRYYYLGSSGRPDAVIAISNRFVLRTRVWAEVEMTPQLLAGWMQMFRTDQTWGCVWRGGVILAADGKQAGVWYSGNIFNLVREPEPGVLEVYQPTGYMGRRCDDMDGDGPVPW